MEGDFRARTKRPISWGDFCAQLKRNRFVAKMQTQGGFSDFFSTPPLRKKNENEIQERA